MCAAVQDHVATQPEDKGYPVPRPRLVLADDNDLLLDRVVKLLAGEFDVVGLVSNGRDLLELVVEISSSGTPFHIGFQLGATRSQLL